MKFKNLALGVLGGFLALEEVNCFQDVRKNFNGHKVIEIHTHQLSEEIVKTLNKHEVDQLNSYEGKLSFKVSPEVFEALNNAENSPFEDTTEKWINQLQQTLDDPNVFCRDHHLTCARRELVNFHSSYQTLAAITARVDELVAESSVPVNLKQIGTSFEGRPINVVEIDFQPNKPIAYFMCNIHAREWLTPMYCTYMIELLLQGHELLDTFGFAIIPTGNPDGYEYSVTDNNMWRKTRNTNPGSFCRGTDGNRNYADHHGGEGTSDNPCSDIYCGPAPFSTPEVAAVENYGRSIQSDIITWTDFHAYGGYWLSPLGWSTDYPPADDYSLMLACMTEAQSAVQSVHGQVFEIGPAGALLYPAAGASDDYFYADYGLEFSFTVEMRGNSFQPPPSNIILSNEEIFAGMVAQMNCIKEIKLEGSIPPSFAPTPPPTRFCPWWFC